MKKSDIKSEKSISDAKKGMRGKENVWKREEWERERF